jgi:hypothetical protein
MIFLAEWFHFAGIMIEGARPTRYLEPPRKVSVTATERKAAHPHFCGGKFFRARARAHRDRHLGGRGSPHSSRQALPTAGNQKMSRLSTVLILTALSSVLTPVVVSATGTAPSKPAAAQAQGKTEAAAAPSQADQPTCTRRVKVVYAGYGEGRGGACTVTAEVQR